MTALQSNNSFLTSVLIAIVVGFISLPGYAQKNAPWVGETLEGEECQSNVVVGFGPYDYLLRAQFPAELEAVENEHFTPYIENLEKGKTSSAINDIGYTLMTWPNHHRALHSAMKFRMGLKKWPEDSQYPPAECQLQKAIKFSPNDPVPYIMYGLMLHKAKQYEKALFVYTAANRLNPNDILTLYNMGLTQVALEQYDAALKTAETVYAAGMPLPGLKNKLIAAGQWPTATQNGPAQKAPPKVELQAKEDPAEKSAQKNTPTKKAIEP